MDSSPSPSPAPPQASAPARGASNASLRWDILRRALLARSSSCASDETSNDQQNRGDTNKISRKTSRGFNLIECHALPISQLTKSHGNSLNRNENDVQCQKDVYVCYELPCGGSPKLNLVYRRDDSLELTDIEASNRYNIDTTGLVCCWPSEEVLAFYCMNHSDMFRSKKVLELGSGYGLAGLVIAASTNADEVVISDGNPQVVGYIQQNISINADTFGETKVKSMILHWDQEQASEMLNSFDIIVASDCARILLRCVNSVHEQYLPRDKTPGGNQFYRDFLIHISLVLQHIFQAIPSQACPGSQILVDAFRNLASHLSEPEER